MAKKQASTRVVKKKIESLLLVTEKNRKFCVVLGRTMYAYQKNGSQYNKLGEFVIRPRLKKGVYSCDGVETYIREDESRETYASSFDEVITYLIKKNQLFIDTKQNLSKFNV